MRRFVPVAGLSALVALAALSGAAPAPAPTAAPSQSADTYTIDPVHSTVLFRCKHLNTSYSYGRFDEVSGTIDFDDANPASSSLTVTVSTKSVSTANAKRDGHLRSADFFSASEFPTATFKSKSFAKADGNNFDVTGDLTIKGVTRPVSFKLEKTGAGKGPGGPIIGFEGTVAIQRADFGINYMPDGLGAEVRLTFSFEAGKK
ncbi:MAG: YceI family protein [Phycisphaerae bacterium]|nr:YceI family protein [Phycisphaerae bacterium]